MVTIFCGSDPIDETLLKKLKPHLCLLANSNQVKIWYESEIQAGANWQQEIDMHLKKADIALLLVSPEFLVSHEWHIQQIVNLHKKSKISCVIPLLIRSSGWKYTSLGKLQPLPRDERPITRWNNKDEAFVHVVDEIKEIVDSLLSKPQQPSDVKDGFFFVGLVPTNGYRWDNDLRPAPGLVGQEHVLDAPWLISQAVGLFELSRRYPLFDEPNILRDFANLSPTAEAILQFANRYGALDADMVPLYYPGGKPDNMLWVGESLRLWIKEIRKMKRLVTLWDMIKGCQIEALREHIIWKLDPMDVLFVWQDPDGRTKATIASDNKLFSQWRWGEVVRPALYYLCTEINKQMQGHIGPALLPSSEMEMYMVPDGFHAALYVLLAMEVREHQIGVE
jgi:hypothetical protein